MTALATENLLPGSGRSHRRCVPLRGAALLAILVGEALGLTIGFDSGAASDRLIDDLIGHLIAIARVGIVMVTVGYLVIRKFRGEGTGPSRGLAPARWSWPFVLVHLGCLALFTWLTSVVLSGGPWPVALGLAWAAVWSLAALATLLSWVAIWLEPARWPALALRGPGLFLGLGAVGLATWGAGRIATGFWGPLGRLTLDVVHFLLGLWSNQTIYDPRHRLVGTSRFSVEITPQCSGYEGIGMILVLVVCFLWISRRDLLFPRSLLLIPLGVVLIWLANVARITTLILIGSRGYEGLALGGFHSVAGWLAFIAIGLGIVLAARSSTYFARDAASDGLAATESPTGPFLLPLMAILVTAMVSHAFVEGFDVLYPLRIVTVGAVLLAYWPRYRQLQLGASWQAVVLGVAAYAVWMACEFLGRGGHSPEALARVTPPPMPPTSLVLWLAFRVLGSVVLVPIAEELAFRAYLTRRLIAADYWDLPIGVYSRPSFLISSVLFGLLHDRWVAGTLAGMIFAAALYRRRELGDAIAAHATTNALIAATVLLTGDWSLWA